MANLWQAFDRTCAATPDMPALVMASGVVPFTDLRDMALDFAGRLTALGVGKGDVVALQLPKRAATYAMLLGCLGIGAPYVFVDPKNPAERTSRILATLNPKVLVTTGDAAIPVGTTLAMDAAGEIDWRGVAPVAIPDIEITGSDPAYIMFTSGSTGEPKGAVIPHQGVASLMEWARDFIHRGDAERFTAINPLHFDNSVFDIYCGLVSGAALVPVETSEITNPASWVRAIRAGGATVFFAVPTLFLVLDQIGLLTPEKLPSVHTYQFGGEGYPIGRLRDFHRRFEGRARLVNVYGPTETSCICTSLDVEGRVLEAPDDAFPPLGRMHPNFSWRVLDDEGNAVPAGEAGELWIGGPCVGLGYYANPAETAKRFVQDPAQPHYRSISYRSGDLVREDAEGTLWFVGRVDNQVKIRGHRIELEEIDLAVQSVPGVSRALAVVRRRDGDAEIAVAFMADRRVDDTEIRDLCRARLPAYMQPAALAQLERLPQNANGKVDRKAVARLFQESEGAA